MKIKVYQKKINGVLSVIIATTDWSKFDLDSIIKLGEPEIDIGGVFKKLNSECSCIQGEYQSNSDLKGKVVGFFDKLNKVEEADVDCGDDIAKTILELKDAANSEPTYTDEVISENPECFFELGHSNRKIRSDFPIMIDFTVSDSELEFDVQEKAKSWSDTIVKRIVREIKKLRAMSEMIIKEEVYEV
jgi:hypothetical protein